MYSRQCPSVPLSVWLSVPCVPSLPSPRLVVSALCTFNRQYPSGPLSDWLSVPSVCTVDTAPVSPLCVHPICLVVCALCMCPSVCPLWEFGVLIVSQYLSCLRPLYVCYSSVTHPLDARRRIPVIATIWYILFDLTSGHLNGWEYFVSDTYHYQFWWDVTQS